MLATRTFLRLRASDANAFDDAMGEDATMGKRRKRERRDVSQMLIFAYFKV